MNDHRVLAFIVGRNEADRWLESTLKHNTALVDESFFYDDQSTDDTLAIAREFATYGVSRGDDEPSFLESESGFKNAAWKAFETAMQPREGDYVISIDCDEIVMTPSGSPETLHLVARFLSTTSSTSVMVPIPELWDIVGTKGLARIDGYWGSNSLPRFFEYKNGGRFDSKSMGCGCAPTYAYVRPSHGFKSFHILHLGYAVLSDRKSKYKRYTDLSFHGHNNDHIESILSSPTLRPLPYELPDLWRGVRWRG